MGAFEQAVEQAILKYVGKLKFQTVLSGIAKDVNDTTCTVERENAPILHDVRLNAIDESLESYVTVIPAENSHVLVAIIENLKTEAVVIRCSEVQKVIIKIGTQILVLDKDGLVFNEGKNNGLVKIASMVDWMAQVYNDLQTLKTQLSTHPTAGNGAILGLTFTPTTPNPSQDTFEDTKFKH